MSDRVNLQKGPASRQGGSASPNMQSGQIAMAAVMFFLFVILVILGAYATLAIGQLNGASQIIISKKVYATAESGAEDAAFRTKYFRTTLHTPLDVPLNNGVTTIASIDIDPDHENATDDYLITSTARTSSVYRTAKMLLEIPDGSLLVEVKGALEIGSMGFATGGNTKIQGNNIDGGKFYSNGSFISGGSSPDLIEGDITLAQGTSTDPSLTLKTDETTPSSMISLGINPTYYDVAQKFIAPFTGQPTNLSLYISGSQSNTFLQCFDGFYIVGNKIVSGIDYPDSTKEYFKAPGSYGALTISTTPGWRNIPLLKTPSAEALTSNEPYWIIIDQHLPRSAACLSNNIQIGSKAVDELNQDSDTLYYNNPAFYSVSPTNTGIYGMRAGTDRSIYMPNYISTSEVLVAGVVVATPPERDISFQLSFGISDNTIGGTVASDNATVKGNVIAGRIRGIDIWGEAFYKTVNTSPSPGTPNNWDLAMTIAGGNKPLLTRIWETDNDACPVNIVSGNSSSGSNAQCGGSGCRGMSTGQLSPYNPGYGYTRTNFCQCVDGDISTGSQSFCHDLDQLPNFNPITDPLKQIPPQTPLFTYRKGPITGRIIERAYSVVTGGPLSLACYGCTGNWVKQKLDDSTPPLVNPPLPIAGDPGAPAAYTYRKYSMYLDESNDTVAVPAGSRWVVGAPLNTLEINGADYGHGIGTTTFQLPAYINGNLVVKITATTGGKIDLASGPPNTMVDASKQPFILWIKGNLTLLSSDLDCSISTHQPYSAYTAGKPTGIKISDINGNSPPDTSYRIFVEGKVNISKPCVARVFSSDLQNYMQIISLHSGVGPVAGTDFAIRLGGHHEGSAFYAPRGGIVLDSSGGDGVMNLRVASANFLKLIIGSTLRYLEGTPPPYSEFGGESAVGANIQSYKESE